MSATSFSSDWIAFAGSPAYTQVKALERGQEARIRWPTRRDAAVIVFAGFVVVAQEGIHVAELDRRRQVVRIELQRQLIVATRLLEPVRATDTSPSDQ